MRKITFKESNFWVAVAVASVAMEVITVLCDIIVGHSTEELNATQLPFLQKIHHMLWAIPFIVTGLMIRGKAASYYYGHWRSA